MTLGASCHVSEATDPFDMMGNTPWTGHFNAIFQKAGAILYWAWPQDMDALFADPRVCAMRPSQIGIC